MAELPLQSKQDSKYFSESQNDPSVGSATEGGYEYTRPKYTRTPTKTWIIGFTDLTNDDRITLQNFWEYVKGGSVVFEWTHPISGVTHNVRFGSALDFQYAGMGYTYHWNVFGIKLKEV